MFSNNIDSYLSSNLGCLPDAEDDHSLYNKFEMYNEIVQCFFCNLRQSLFFISIAKVVVFGNFDNKHNINYSDSLDF